MRTRSAKPNPSTSSQPIATTPTSPPSRLPPEVIAHIHALAEDEETPGKIKRLRATFELVNKEWYNIVDYFTHIVITKLSDVTRLTTKLRSSKLRALLMAKTKSISLVLHDIERSGDVKRVCGLLKWVNQAESVSIEDVNGAALTRFEPSSASSVVDGLSSFRNLRHFTFRQGLNCFGRGLRVSIARIMM
jgi:hypothetical protein